MPSWTVATCTFPVPTTGVHGELTVDGGPLPSNASGDVRLAYTFTVDYRSFYGTNGTVLDVGCREIRGNATTAPNGSFSFVPVAPQGNCTPVDGQSICTVYSEPYAPVNVTLAAGIPDGYVLSTAGWDGSIAVALVYELASVTIAPGGPTVTTSVGAPTAFVASTWAANGSRSPLNATFAWSLSGTGWSFDGPPSGASVALTAVDGASVAIVTVHANATAQGGTPEAVVATVDVVAVATQIETGETNRTALDVGGSIQVRLTSFGAAGFRYSAFVEPGLGLAAVAAPCATGSPNDGTVEVTCAANVTYPSAGTSQPTANVTNGYSTASWKFPEVVVSPSPELEVDPAAPVGYVLDPVDVALTAADGSGATPYARACLDSGVGVLCDAAPGPTWTFAPIYPIAGNYSADAWAVDADGTNASMAFTVDVVPSLVVGPIVVSGPNASVSSPTELRSTVAGGVTPLRYWWNASGVAGPLLDGDLAADGPLNVTVVPTVPGPLVVTLTVIDRLGTVVASTLLLEVGPAAAELVAAITVPPAGPITVGEPVPLAWGAFDLAGVPNPSFAAPVELDLATGEGSPGAWVNASGVGALARLGGGAFGVPASAWVEGVLSVTVTFGTAATVAIQLSGAGLPGPVAPVSLQVGPDRAHLRLSAPSVARAGGRANSTLWHVEDRFGNPVPGALLTVGLSFGGVRDDAIVSTVTLPGGGSGVWVNYSAPTAGVGEVTVVDGAGEVVLGPLAVPAAPAPAGLSPAIDALAAAAPVGAVGLATLAVARRRRRARASSAGEDELRSLAEGRARTVELIGRAGTVDLAGLEASWEPPPAPPALADWLASLVADGTIRATVAAGDRPVFCLAEDRPGAGDVPRVTVDREALDRSLRHRDDELRADGEGEGDRST